MISVATPPHSRPEYQQSLAAGARGAEQRRGHVDQPSSIRSRLSAAKRAGRAALEATPRRCGDRAAPYRTTSVVRRAEGRRHHGQVTVRHAKVEGRTTCFPCPSCRAASRPLLPGPSRVAATATIAASAPGTAPLPDITRHARRTCVGAWSGASPSAWRGPPPPRVPSTTITDSSPSALARPSSRRTNRRGDATFEALSHGFNSPRQATPPQPPLMTPGRRRRRPSRPARAAG